MSIATKRLGNGIEFARTANSFTPAHCERTIRKIASFGPVVEMGAGRGYWAYCLNQIECDVIAYNEDVPPQWGPFKDWSHLFFPVQVGTPQVLREHGDRTLFLVWPPLNDPMGADCLRYWKGRYLCYVGETARAMMPSTKRWSSASS